MPDKKGLRPEQSPIIELCNGYQTLGALVDDVAPKSSLKYLLTLIAWRRSRFGGSIQ